MSLSRSRLSAEAWNDPLYRTGQGVSWTAPVCNMCWEQEYGNRSPVRVVPPDAKVCSNCGAATRSGIFRRIAPDEQVFKAWQWIEL